MGEVSNVGLKQSIVVRSEYTNNANSKPGGGSRGASPGQFVMQYMARDDATEVVAPVRMQRAVGDSYDSAMFTRYMIRDTAIEGLKDKTDLILNDADAYGSPLVLKHKLKGIDDLSGRAFGNKGVSLSHDELVESSELIQEAFDVGHSVQKIVISFTEDYLRETGVLNPEFEHRGRGSYKGQTDQLKLREAIAQGVDDMTRTGRFVDPEWVGTIQFDTSHVHAHIALVDKEFSQYRMKDDGADRGKINKREKRMFRKGLNHSLEDMKQLHSFHKQSSLERQNVVSYVKDYAYHTIQENTPMQLLVASLPEDRSTWRYGTNRDSMVKANELAVGIIEDTFKNKPYESGYDSAIKAVYNYADESEVKNRLTPKQKESVVKNGRDQIVERTVNGLYSTLKEIDDLDLHIRTTMTDIQSSSDDELKNALMKSKTSGDKNDFDPAAFALRVRGYNNRLNMHKDKAKVYHDLSDGYDQAFEDGHVDDSAHVMRIFYEEEQQYHMGLVDKYRTFLSFHHDDDRESNKVMIPEYERLTETYESIVDNEASTGIVLHHEREDYKKDLKDYTFKCFDKGVGSLKEWKSIVDYDRQSETIETRFVLPIQPKKRVDNLSDSHFDTVKALDVHHLGLDYYNKMDARIDSGNALNFANTFGDRNHSVSQARHYVDSTGQDMPILSEVESDVDEMGVAVAKAVDEGLIDAVTFDDLTSTEKRQLYTISVDRSFDIPKKVKEILDVPMQLELDFGDTAPIVEPEVEDGFGHNSYGGPVPE